MRGKIIFNPGEGSPQDDGKGKSQMTMVLQPRKSLSRQEQGVWVL